MEIKNLYESVMILGEKLTNEEYKVELEKIKDYFKNCEIINFEEMGLRKLAYEIKNNKQGFYILVEFQSKSDEIREIERLYRIDDNILKFIVIRKDC